MGEKGTGEQGGTGPLLLGVELVRGFESKLRLARFKICDQNGTIVFDMNSRLTQTRFPQL